MKQYIKLLCFFIVLIIATSCNTKECICTLEYAPVCGSNNVTYGNDCEAECDGIKTYSLGECP